MSKGLRRRQSPPEVNLLKAELCVGSTGVHCCSYRLSYRRVEGWGSGRDCCPVSLNVFVEEAEVEGGRDVGRVIGEAGEEEGEEADTSGPLKAVLQEFHHASFRCGSGVYI